MEQSPVFKAGYDAWIEHWTRTGFIPGAGDCPAKYMKAGGERSDFLKGWLLARAEFIGDHK